MTQLETAKKIVAGGCSRIACSDCPAFTGYMCECALLNRDETVEWMQAWVDKEEAQGENS